MRGRAADVFVAAPSPIPPGHEAWVKRVVRPRALWTFTSVWQLDYFLPALSRLMQSAAEGKGTGTLKARTKAWEKAWEKVCCGRL